MAPFGKNFLKARLKNRTKDAEPVVGKEIQVTVCNEEKVICGVTKHTTCADMIQALLDDHKSVPESKRLLHGEPKDFCLVERWKGFERALPPLTRILRLWYAWGDQRPAIQFILVKTSDFVPQPTNKGGKSKGAKPKRWEQGRAQYTQSLPVERQKRMVKKAFRKLEKIHKDSKSSQGADEIDRMVQLILNQDHTIREQIQSMRELDLEIERFQLQAQKEAESESSLALASGQSLEMHSDKQLHEYLYTSDGVEQLELQVQRHQELILQLSQSIDAELRRANFPLNSEEQEGAATASWIPLETDESFYTAELERLQDELKRSLFTGVSLHNQTAEIEKQLKYYGATLVSKDQECWQLAAQLSSLQIEDREEEEETIPVPLKSETQCNISQTVKLKHTLSPPDITDTDSDTGISSTHSQDSLSPCLEFPPPLDTDV
ncbi:ras association domain-containing protein 9 [Micropterus dolomieu]|uniref:ras association domain-containing protein 9 n=1 Tax=Micropterus dolomieu TaxID=147949 RepID=UPI001E8DEF2F|nr:ras association domain-containing protein 9 [Micropterus dolomieu]